MLNLSRQAHNAKITDCHALFRIFFRSLRYFISGSKFIIIIILLKLKSQQELSKEAGLCEVLVPLLHLLLDGLQPAAEPLEHVLRPLLAEHPAGRRG